MKSRSRDWKQLFKLAQSEADPARRVAICVRVRRLIQDRSLELASDGDGSHDSDPSEEDQLNQALRDLWVLQNSIS